MKDPIDAAALGEWFGELAAWDVTRVEPPAGARETIRYGSHPDQCIDVWSASTAGGPVVISLHGGYFMSEYDKGLHTAIARQLALDGFVVCNVEYRRGPGAHAASITDVQAAVAAIVERFGNAPLAVFGHSAGGYLCEIAAEHERVELALLLAPVSDLAEASHAGWDAGAIAAWLGTGPDDAPELYRSAGLAEIASGGGARVLIHGTDDRAVGVGQSRAYVAALAREHREPEYIELPDEGHFGYLDPREPAFDVVRDQLLRWSYGSGDGRSS